MHRRFQAPAGLLEYAAYSGVNYMVFENLFGVERWSKLRSPGTIRG